jgi:hypothetical protein
MSKQEAVMRITGHANGTGGGCSDGTCPAIYDTDNPAVVAVQGSVLTDGAALAGLGEVPGHETVVLIPRALLDSYRPEVS